MNIIKWEVSNNPHHCAKCDANRYLHLDKTNFWRCNKCEHVVGIKEPTKNTVQLRLYKLTQAENTGSNTYDSMVVCAASEEKARKLHPLRCDVWLSKAWASTPNNVTVEYIGDAWPGVEIGGAIIIASFNAG